MKKTLIATAAACALGLFAAPAFAQVGDIGLSIGTLNTSTDETSIWSLSGSAAAEVSDGLTAQVELLANDVFEDTRTIGGGGGLLMRSDRHAFGANVLYFDLEHDELWEGGAFVQTYAERFVGTGRIFFGTVSPQTSSSFIDEDISYRGIDLDGQFFLNDNASVNVGTTYTDFESLNGIWGGHIGFEWKPEDAPVGVFFDGGFTDEVTFFQLGARATFGAGTLRERVEQGAVHSGNPAGRFISAVSAASTVP